MQIFRSRPVAVATMSAIAAAVLSFFLTATGTLLLWISALFLFAVLMVIYLLAGRAGLHSAQRQTILLTASLVCIATALIVLASWVHFHLASRMPDTAIDDGAAHEVELLIEEEGSAGVGYSYFRVSLRRIDGESVRGMATMECAYTATYHVGDILRANVNLQSLEAYYDADELYFAIADEIRVVLIHKSDMDIQKIGEDAMPLRRFFAHLRAELSARLLFLTGKQNGGLASALFLGNRELLDPHISRDFQRTGVSHLLALSGMHVTLLMGMVALLTARFGIPKRGRLMLLSVLLLGYLALIGFRLSAVRAAGMLLLWYGAQMLGRRHDPLTTLCLVGWGMLTVMPSSVADGGFWMSFTAVFGLVTVLPNFNEWLISSAIPKKIHTLVQGIVASLIAVIAVSVCTWLFCGEIAPIGILLTVMLTPIMTCILTLIPSVLLLDMLPIFSPMPLNIPLSLALRLMREMTSYVSEFRNVCFSLRIPYVGVILVLMTAVLFVMLILPIRRKTWLLVPPILATALVIVFSCVWSRVQFDDQLHLNYVTRSSGSILAVTDREGTAMIDTSSGSFSMLRDAEKTLRDHGMIELEHLILTHYHRAYTYSVERLAQRCLIRYVWVPLPQSEADYFCLRALYERLTPLGAELICYHPGEPVTLFGDAVFSLTDTSYIDRSSQPILTYLLQTPNEILTFSSPTVCESPYYPTFRWIVEQSDILILSEHGPRVKQPLTISEDAVIPELILTDTDQLISLTPMQMKENILRIPMGDNIKYQIFTMEK